MVGPLPTGRIGASRGTGCGIRSDGIIRKAGLGGGVQEFLSLLEASSSTATETVPSASSWFEDVARSFVVPDPDFASKLLPFVTLTIAIGTAVGKVRYFPRNILLPRPPRSFPEAACKILLDTAGHSVDDGGGGDDGDSGGDGLGLTTL